jgi:hypothetical protein
VSITLLVPFERPVEKISPYEGASRIWSIYNRCGWPKSLIPFVGFASEWEDDLGHREHYDGLIVEAAKKYLQTNLGEASPVQIRYEITPSDHLEMLKVRFGVSARLTKILIGISGILLGIFGYHFFGHTWIVVIAVFVTLTVTQLFMPYIVHRRIYYRNPRLFEMRTVTFSDEGLRSEKDSGSVEAKWSSFEKFKETKNLFLTYQTKDVVGIVPKRAFLNPEAVAQFRNLLASKLPSS